LGITGGGSARFGLWAVLPVTSRVEREPVGVSNLFEDHGLRERLHRQEAVGQGSQEMPASAAD